MNVILTSMGRRAGVTAEQTRDQLVRAAAKVFARSGYEGATIADIAVFPPAMLSHDSGIGHEDYPAINLWQRRLRKLPGFIGMPGIPDYF